MTRGVGFSLAPDEIPMDLIGKAVCDCSFVDGSSCRDRRTLDTNRLNNLRTHDENGGGEA